MSRPKEARIAHAEPEALLARIGRGDEAALAEFHRLFEARVYRYAAARLNDPFEAADIATEVFLEVWRHADRFEGRSKASTWVLGIARHKTLDRLRRRGRQAEAELDPEMPDADAPDPSAAVAAAENADFVRRCMERLSPAHREVVHLAFFEDLSYPEIAGIVGCPEGTVKTRMFHAKRALKRCLAALMGEAA